MRTKSTINWLEVALATLVFGAWIVSFYCTFFYEWWVNEQYSYGFIVPFLAGYLIYLRWVDRPTTQLKPRPRLGWTIAIAVACLLIPLEIILGSNPEWRAALWTHALLTVAGILALLGTMGGWSWVLHFTIPVALICFAVPWPTQFEQPIVHFLMRGVSTVTVEFLNLAGHFAQREGNIILLSSTRIGVEEACSGVRSLQSTLMAAFFLGELFRWKIRYRLALIVAGTAVSLLLNLVRTLILTFVAIRQGTEAMEVVHDPVGHAVSIGAFLLLFLLTWILHQRFLRMHAESDAKGTAESAFSSSASPVPIARVPAAVLLTIFCLQLPIAALWYREPTPMHDHRHIVDFEWSALGSTVSERDISPAVRSILRFTEGESVTFRWNRLVWSAYFFRWEKGRVSSHVAVHRPEVCLPSAGFRLIETGSPVRWEDNGLEVVFQSQAYTYNNQSYYVFYASWDTMEHQDVPFASTWQDRLENAWRGIRFEERQSAQIIVRGAPSLAAAQSNLRKLLRETMQVSTLPRRPLE
jgi:exosortase